MLYSNERRVPNLCFFNSLEIDDIFRDLYLCFGTLYIENLNAYFSCFPLNKFFVQVGSW